MARVASSLSWVALTVETAPKSLQLGLFRHPAGGRTPDAHHAAGGLITVYPRRIARDTGFVAGSSNDPAPTITCIGVAEGYPRTNVIGLAMGHLLATVARGVGDCRWVEWADGYGWPEGTNPYWGFDKHGFDRVREIVPGRSVLMRRRL